MEEEAKAEPGSELFPKDWREQVQLYGGRKGFVRKELKRLGFWPPQPGSRYVQTTQAEEAELEILYAQLVELRRPLLDQIGQIDKSIEDARQRVRDIGDGQVLARRIEAIIAETRQLRIARVKQERAERKIRRAQEREESALKYLEWRDTTLPHLGRGVSHSLQFEREDENADIYDTRLRALSLPILHSAEELASAIGVSTSQLAWLSYHRVAATISHYNHFTIPKKSGGRRSISSPKPKLREAQSWILGSILAPVPCHEAAMAFRAGVSITHNAQRHAGCQVLMRIDLKDFFPSITFARVRRMFQVLGYNKGISTILALLCTESPRVEAELDGRKYFVALSERFLPQGACTSPAITNILCRHMDARLEGAARRYGFTYTRYADDLIFSSSDAQAQVLGLRHLVEQIIADEKFTVNADKTAIMRARSRQSVTGLVINASHQDGQPRVSRTEMRKFRAFLHGFETLGAEAMSAKIGQDARSYAEGFLSFIHMVSPEQAARVRAANPWLQPRRSPED